MKSFPGVALAITALVFSTPAFAGAPLAPTPTTVDYISAMQYGNSLFINGNNNNNLIWIGQSPSGKIVVLGLGGVGVETSINGAAPNTFSAFSGVENIFVNTFGGHDLVIATNNIYALHECLDFDLLDEVNFAKIPTTWYNEKCPLLANWKS